MLMGLYSSIKEVLVFNCFPIGLVLMFLSALSQSIGLHMLRVSAKGASRWRLRHLRDERSSAWRRSRHVITTYKMAGRHSLHDSNIKSRCHDDFYSIFMSSVWPRFVYLSTLPPNNPLFKERRSPALNEDLISLKLPLEWRMRTRFST